MKTLILAFTLSMFSVAAKAQAYTYHNYPDTTIAWSGYRPAFGGYYPFINIVKGETIINGYSFYNVTQQITSPSVIGYVREDSAKTLHCAYYHPYDGWQAAPFCNFTLDVGDSLVSGHYTFYITNVDTPLYNGIARKTLSITSIYNYSGNISTEYDTWIDGIGSLLSPIGIYCRIPISLMYTGYNVCRIQDNSFVFYKNNSLPYCISYNDINSPLIEQSLLFPNPATEYIYLRVPDNMRLRGLKVYSIIAELEKELSLEPSFNSEHCVDVSDLSLGIHYLQVIEASGKSTVLKFVVARN